MTFTISQSSYVGHVPVEPPTLDLPVDSRLDHIFKPSASYDGGDLESVDSDRDSTSKLVTPEVIKAPEVQSPTYDLIDTRLVFLFGFLIAVLTAVYFYWMSQYGVVCENEELNTTVQYALNKTVQS